MNPAYMLSTLTVAEFRTFRKALAVLLAAGISREDATDILLRAATTRRQFADAMRQTREMPR